MKGQLSSIGFIDKHIFSAYKAPSLEEVQYCDL